MKKALVFASLMLLGCGPDSRRDEMKAQLSAMGFVVLDSKGDYSVVKDIHGSVFVITHSRTIQIDEIIQVDKYCQGAKK